MLAQNLFLESNSITITLVVLLVAVVAFISNRVPLGVVAVGVAVSLYLSGVLTLTEALGGFGDPTVVFIAALFVVSESLDVTGTTTWLGQKVISHAGSNRMTILTVLCLLTAGVTALISVNGAVAALAPLAVIVAARSGISTSQILLPLAFAAHAGSMLLLTGTPVNIIVSDLAAENGGRAFTYFEFALVGIPLVIVTVAIMAFFGPYLLPNRNGAAIPIDLARYARTLHAEYKLENCQDCLLSSSQGFSEVMVAPRSPLVGLTLHVGMATPSGDLVLLAAKRGGDEILTQKIVTQVGDTLLLQGSWDHLDQHISKDEVLVVEPPSVLRRSVPLGKGAKRGLVILGGMVLLLATGIVPPAIAALLAACALVLTRVLTPTQAYRSVSWTTVVLVAGMIPLSTAFTKTGTANLLAGWLLDALGDSGPRIALLALCVLTVVLGQLISNTATVLIVAPIAVAVAQAMDVSILPFMMALTIAGAASFLTPVATPANLMVMDPGGYRFTDYWKLGLPLAVLFVVFAVFYVPLIWSF